MPIGLSRRKRCPSVTVHTQKQYKHVQEFSKTAGNGLTWTYHLNEKAKGKRLFKEQTSIYLFVVYTCLFHEESPYNLRKYFPIDP